MNSPTRVAQFAPESDISEDEKKVIHEWVNEISTCIDRRHFRSILHFVLTQVRCDRVQLRLLAALVVQIEHIAVYDRLICYYLVASAVIDVPAPQPSRMQLLELLCVVVATLPQALVTVANASTYTKTDAFNQVYAAIVSDSRCCSAASDPAALALLWSAICRQLRTAFRPDQRLEPFLQVLKDVASLPNNVSMPVLNELERSSSQLFAGVEYELASYALTVVIARVTGAIIAAP